MRKDKKQCKKRPFEKMHHAIAAINKIAKNTNRPDSNEAQAYLCDKCNKYHITSLNGFEGKTAGVYKGKSYLEIQREKWSKFIHEKSSKKAVFNI